jgi:hypothetical protein
MKKCSYVVYNGYYNADDDEFYKDKIIYMTDDFDRIINYIGGNNIRRFGLDYKHSKEKIEKIFKTSGYIMCTENGKFLVKKENYKYYEK